MQNIYEIFAEEHPDRIYVKDEKLNDAMESGYETWCKIAPNEQRNENCFLNALLIVEDITTDAAAVYRKEVDMLMDEAEAHASDVVNFTTEEWDYVIEEAQEYYIDLGYAPIIEETDGSRFQFLFKNPDFDPESTITGGYRTFIQFLRECRATIEADHSVVDNYRSIAEKIEDRKSVV